MADKLEETVEFGDFETTNFFGYLPEQDRTEEQNEINQSIVSSMPKFSIIGNEDPSVKKVVLWEFSKQANNGQHFPTFRQVTGSCFPAGTPILMADGSEKPIEKIKVGDIVVSHTGAKRRVVRSFSRKYTGEMHTFHTKGNRMPVTCTNDHNMLVIDSKTQWRWTEGETRVCKAEDVNVGDRMLMAYGLRDSMPVFFDLAEGLWQKTDDISQEKVGYSGKKAKRFVELNEKLSWLIGLYIADGSIHGRESYVPDSIQFSLNPGSKKITSETCIQWVKDLFGEDIEIVIKRPKASCLNVLVKNHVVANLFLRLVPDTCMSKRIPVEVFRCSRSIKMSFLRGWMEGDGHVSLRKIKSSTGKTNHGFGIRGVTASTGLARDMLRLCLSCELKPSVLQRKQYPHQNAAAWDIYLNGNDALCVFPEKSSAVSSVGVVPAKTKISRTKNGYATVVEKIEKNKVFDLDVYCVEVEVDHSLIVNGYLATSQCVGNGGGQAVWYLSAVEVVRLKDPEQVLLPFYLLPYGMSRKRGGLGGRGEGSFGSAFAEAIKLDGILPFNTEGLEQPDFRDGVTWGRNVELKWSDGASISENWLQKSRKHLVKTVSKINSSDDARSAIRNYYPITIASAWGGMMDPPLSGDPAVRLNRRVTTWHHQMCVIGWWEHPTLGELYYVLNSWGPRTHGTPAGDEPPGGFWIKASDMDWICKTGECYAFSQFSGFPAQKFSWFV